MSRDADPGELVPFEYAVVRVVPRIERGEFVNVAVILCCPARDYLGCAGTGDPLDADRLLAVHPGVDLTAVSAALAGIASICGGDTATGPASGGSVSARFTRLTSPRSTVVQTGPVHTGLTPDPQAELEHLVTRLVT